MKHKPISPPAMRHRQRKRRKRFAEDDEDDEREDVIGQPNDKKGEPE